MSQDIQYIHPSSSKWEEIIALSENSYLFHTPAWAKVMEETYGYQVATRLYRADDSEILIPMMKIKRYGFYYYRSMPLGYGGIFSASAPSAETLQKILRNIVGGRSPLLMILLPPFSDISTKGDSSIRVDLGETHVLSLEQGFEYIWKERFVGETRTAVRKAQKSDVKILNENSLGNFRQFYKLYTETTKRWGYKKPPVPLRFYENLCKFASPHVQVRLAIKDGNTIGGQVCLYYGKTVFYMMSAFLKEYQSYRPVKLLMKDSIEQACNEGYKYYNFGASGDLGKGGQGVRKFKESFGPEEVETKCYMVWSRLGEYARRIFRK